MGGGGDSEPYDRGRTGGGAGPGSSDGVNCAALVLEATVMSPDPAVVATVSTGSMCEVLLAGTPPQLRLYLRANGEVLGAITERWVDLTSCIAGGFAYEAEVLTLRPVRVRVRPRRPHRLVTPLTAGLVNLTPGVVLSNGDHLHVSLHVSDGVVVHDAAGAAVGRVISEPVALPEAVREGRASIAHVIDATTGRVVITDT